jgi:hypothetical protein
MQIGGLCRAMTITDVARRMHLDWHTVKELDKLYMREQLARAGPPAPNVIGVDEISVKKRHVYRIVVSDLEQKRAIWFGGNGRSEKDMDMFYGFLGKRQGKRRQNTLGGHGHVEAVSSFDAEPRAASGHSVRQVPHPSPSRRRPR